ncbi:multiple epidermal growth factor-like domains protein 6, partial [Ruditapes philippinarum]|uniref:multiple epidermal growth factor-like domains protein 6 n=1 Tax=Ruditapes philippinarum TaxID=129788 RepID=UPI00295BBB20
MVIAITPTAIVLMDASQVIKEISVKKDVVLESLVQNVRRIVRQIAKLYIATISTADVSMDASRVIKEIGVSKQELRFGTECREICPVNCKDGYCNHVNGNCIYRCNPGYQGDRCERNCQALKFGADCKENCPSNCKNGYCNNVNGNCIHGCEPGYQGDTCEIKCQSGSFGTECRGKCSTTCKNGVCSYTNGYCIGGCEAGYQGSMCESRKFLKLFDYVDSIVLYDKYKITLHYTLCTCTTSFKYFRFKLQYVIYCFDN